MAETAADSTQGPGQGQGQVLAMGTGMEGMVVEPVAPEETCHQVDISEQRLASIDTQRDSIEATELDGLRQRYRRATSKTSVTTTAKKPITAVERFKFFVKQFWRHQIRITVEHRECRDHLALERTFLGYLRTSLALSMLGITVAQLFRLQHSPTPNPNFGFFVLGKPMSCMCQGAAIYTLFIGAFRTWRSQNAIVRGKAISGGFEIILLTLGIFLFLLVFFVLLITVNIEKDDLA